MQDLPRLQNLVFLVELFSIWRVYGVKVGFLAKEYL
jgi:hypothetical protein